MASAGLPLSPDPEHADAAPRHVRHNTVALGIDFGLFLIGLSFASQSTILPAFAAHLGASNVVIGAIPALMTLGWNLPSLFAAGYTIPGAIAFVLCAGGYAAKRRSARK